MASLFSRIFFSVKRKAFYSGAVENTGADFLDHREKKR